MPSVFERNSKTLFRWSPWSWITSPNSSLLTTVPLHAKSWIIHQPSISSSPPKIGRVYLLQSLQNSLLIIFCRNTLDGSQSFTTVALLNADMNVVLQQSISIDVRDIGTCWSGKEGFIRHRNWRLNRRLCRRMDQLCLGFGLLSLLYHA